MRTILLVHRPGVRLRLLHPIIVGRPLVQLEAMRLGHLHATGAIKAMEVTGAKHLQTS